MANGLGTRVIHPESLLLQSFGIPTIAARKDYQDLLGDYQFKDSKLKLQLPYSCLQTAERISQ